jgi:hypothetical protein
VVRDLESMGGHVCRWPGDDRGHGEGRSVHQPGVIFA